ncbi:hypothetical protein A3H80_02285 [Candidatus Roizmanbacteria bacterium RIFCSPLOWO2_02_FULL_37_19]|uniref:Amidophosphoribosyltransferase n=1 Tax=Candidatus Roizmanbacteria bacterium RIFCSPHIGHO2_02_FULL_37_24 TaxID=1802037 RepID=A0A1F7H105_9BACT|nr:MAG: hypothetical protein A2862_02905 [Candidatus Roizmanbacteria bacterium RIFCSPHIGHO2_01_FULL_38_41]OGK24733.1 MAG: hypothetical protein A3C24_01255 [Candidatus Roizmanbacteria bacterium RIFCSPHIGHO2_02_FULL_37_24]OGK32909.1 MAG: hypothetical protein A3E10_03000 [Candidatus Roizmanbacteria bacterium RIFCSPHIGHO2_12_FULL_37_23]OGK44124.1 MAG: hypothetical protein A2956_03680 [Candidatus Roizmanbacteria bacterium RIFCSPLOWO2_01_FULL_37_57]OGK54369.1 MAG: hypothetical protein A3H80_02285 [Ca
MGLEISIDKVIQDKCGIVGVYNKHPKRTLPRALTVANRLQHRGQHGAGIVVKTNRKSYFFKSHGLIQDIFTPKVISKFNKPAQWIITHNRYGTHGGYKKYNLQPCISYAQKTQVVVVQNGEFTSIDKMKKKLNNKKNIFHDSSDTVIFTKLLAEAQGNTWDEKVVSTINDSKGAFSLIIGIDNAMYIARDPDGIRPLLMGNTRDGWVVASETSGLEKIGATNIRKIKRGEILKLDSEGITSLQNGPEGEGHFCDFEWAYFSYPNSSYPTHENGNENAKARQWLSFARFRERCGEIMAEENPVKNATFAVGIPNSGVYVAMGYSNKSGIPYRQVIIRDHYDHDGLQRLFMRDDQMQKISKRILKKLTLNPDINIWRKAIVVVGDDSIVRGNVSERITKAILSLGAKEVHWVIGFPPVAHPCFLGVSMRSGEELIAHRFNSDPKKIAQAIGATSVNYISPKGFIQARKLSSNVKMPKDPRMIFLENGGCAGCITGMYPIERE